METGKMYSDVPAEKNRSRRRSGSGDRRSHRSRSRSREREWDRGKDKYWVPDRDRGSRGRYRERERDRDRYHSRSRSRSRDRDSRDKYRRDNRDRSRESDYNNKKKSDSDYSLETTAIIMLRNVKPTVRKEDITRTVGSAMSYVRDVRLIHKKDGMSGFAFLEFYKVADAMEWMQQNQDTFLLLGDHVSMEYCKQRKGHEVKDMRKDFEGDWACFKCSTLNFARRRLCLMCDCPRSESESLHEDVREGRMPKADDIKSETGEEECVNKPTNILIFRGLDTLTTESAVREAIRGISELKVKAMRLIKDKVTNTSRGFCFVELSSEEEAASLMEAVKQQYPALFIDGKRVIVNYARQHWNTPGASSSSVASAAIAQAQWSMSTTPGASVASTQQPKNNKNNSLQQANQQASDKEEKYPSTYSYDETSGMYYDSATGLYYDPKTQYHYNGDTGLYCYYDSTLQTYISVDQDGNPLPATQTTSSTTTTTTTAKGTKSKKGDAAAKSLNAKKIAKDMARWAKNVNAAKSAQQHQIQAVIQQERTEGVPETNTTPDVAFSAIKRTGVPLASALAVSESKPSLSSQMVETFEPPSVRVPAGGDADPAHTDWSQLACLLCQRKFNSKEMLLKHQQLSELHKQNLQKSIAMQNQMLAAAAAPTEEIKYRDRAKERRDKFGTPAVIPGWKKRLERELVKEQAVIHEEPTRDGIKGDNVGSKMLQAMGWSEGEGLGRAKQGIVEPIQAERRTASAGLGSTGSKYASLYSSAGTYKDTLKQLTKARFDEAFR